MTRGPLLYALLGTGLACLVALLAYLALKHDYGGVTAISVAIVTGIVNGVLGRRLKGYGPQLRIRGRKPLVP